jgi:pentose-5-phosphate-3-epimerase
MGRRVEIAPSVLPCDFARLGEEVAALEQAGVDRIQWDVMDAQFVPNSAGVALKPATPPSAVAHVLDLVDLVLVMTVNPGFGGQAYIATMEPKITQVRDMIDAAGHDVDV